MKPEIIKPLEKPERVTGVTHLFAAAGYSIGGLRRLWMETAFRHIIVALPIGSVLLYIMDAGFADFLVFLVLFSALVAVEALNTAIECIVDHLAPQWEVFARDAKDLGSLATMCLLFANGFFMAVVALRYFGMA
jgi:diacylglycerol kinase (ATP)